MQENNKNDNSSDNAVRDVLLGGTTVEHIEMELSNEVRDITPLDGEKIIKQISQNQEQ